MCVEWCVLNPYHMNCTHNYSNVVCTEQELSTLISVQFYTVFALGAGLYMYKSFTAENWADIAVQLGWGCVSAFTHTKRFAFRYVIPSICATTSFIANRINKKAEIEAANHHCYVHVVKDGVELCRYSSIFSLIKHLENASAQDQASESSSDSSSVSTTDTEQTQDETQDETQEAPTQTQESQDSDDVIDVQNEDDEAAESNPSHDDDDPDDRTCDIRRELARIENHTMQFDFVMCQVPTPDTIVSETPMCMNVIKYDGFPRETDGSYFFERKFTPINHRMMEIVLKYNGSEYDLNLSTPDNFYVVGNKLLEPAFLKWFMRKNHGISIDIPSGADDAYTIKCVDNNANLQTLHPCNFLHVTETGFEVLDSGLV